MVAIAAWMTYLTRHNRFLSKVRRGIQTCRSDFTVSFAGTFSRTFPDDDDPFLSISACCPGPETDKHSV